MRIEMAALCREYAAKLSLPDDLIIDIRLLKRVRAPRPTRGSGRFGPVIGAAWPSRDDSKLFLIEIKVNDDMKATLMHELVHVAQFASGRLQHRYLAHIFWEGKDYGPASKIDYDMVPWEIEARELEVTT